MNSTRIAPLILMFLFLRPVLGSAEQNFAISCKNIHALRIEESPDYWSVVVKLSPEGTKLFHEITSDPLGNAITISSEGHELLRTRVYEPIESGYIDLRAPTKKEALRLAKKICSSKLENEPSSIEKLQSLAGVAEYPKGVSIPAFPVSCENVTHIRILKIKDFIWHDSTGDGYMYLVQVVLSPKSSEELLRTLESSPPTVFTLNGSTLTKKYIQLSAQGRTILSDAPTRDGFSDQGILLTKRTKQAAMDCARAICPEKISF